jgi:GNAT superfamily N-acetyltransferase
MDEAKIITVDADNVEKERFFCYKSKPKTPGYQKKLTWLKARFEEGLRIKILYHGKRSFGFIEYLPGEYAWRAVHAPGYMLIHCIWVVGKGKGRGFGSQLLAECIQDARSDGMHGVAMVTSSRVWLVDKPLLLKNGFVEVAQAPPSFDLVVLKFDQNAPDPTFPIDWEDRATRCGEGLTVFRSDQCPYIEDATLAVVNAGAEAGVETRVVTLQSAQEVRDTAPSAYGLFNIVYNGELYSYYLKKGIVKFINEQK